MGHRELFPAEFYWSSCVNTAIVCCLTRCRCFPGNPPSYFGPLRWEKFNSNFGCSKVHRLKSCLGRGSQLNLPPSHSNSLLSLWLTFIVCVTVASHACVQTCRRTIVLHQSLNPSKKKCPQKRGTCLLYLPVKSCSSSHRAQPSSCPVTAVSVVSVGWLTVCSIFLQHLEPAYTKPSQGAFFSHAGHVGSVFEGTVWNTGLFQVLGKIKQHDGKPFNKTSFISWLSKLNFW